MTNAFVDTIGFFAAISLPLFNIPLILRIIQRKSSQDISLSWAIGVWICIMLMFPAGVKSADVVFRVFSYLNIILFSMVVLVTIKYRRKKGR